MVFNLQNESLLGERNGKSHPQKPFKTNPTPQLRQSLKKLLKPGPKKEKNPKPNRTLPGGPGLVFGRCLRLHLAHGFGKSFAQRRHLSPGVGRSTLRFQPSVAVSRGVSFSAVLFQRCLFLGCFLKGEKSTVSTMFFWTSSLQVDPLDRSTFCLGNSRSLRRTTQVC